MKNPTEEKHVQMRTFDVRATYTISKKVSVLTDDYDIETLEDGSAAVCTDKTYWEDVYTEDHYTIRELLDKLADMLKSELRRIPYNSSKAIGMRKMLNDCYGWEIEESNYEEA